MPAPEAAIAIAGYEGDDVDVRPWYSGDDEFRGNMSELSATLLFPRCDEGTCAAVVDQRRSRRSEREPPARTLAAARNRPGARRTAAGTQRRRAVDEPPQARATNRCAHAPADGAPAWNDDVEEPHPRT